MAAKTEIATPTANPLTKVSLGIFTLTLLGGVRIVGLESLL